MKLLTKELQKKLPPIYSGEHLPEIGDNIAIVKYFCPWNQWTWYATEYDGDDSFFGLIQGDFQEWGYFLLSELASVRGPYGLTIERDLHFKPTKIKEVLQNH